MAAWADRALPADAAAAVELHLSNCDRCQEVLAAFVRSAPASGAVVIPFWARRPVQWSAAGLAAAAALVAMIWIGRPPSAQAPESTVALRDAVQSTPPAPVDQIAPPAEPRQEKSAAATQERAASAADLRRDRPSTPPSQSSLPSRSIAKSAKKAASPVTTPPSLPPAVTMPPG